MSDDRFVVLGVAGPRAAWFREMARLATAGSLPVEFVTCVSVAEVRARLGGGRPFSALFADGTLAAVDRDLVDTAARAGCVTVVVDDPRSGRDWSALGAVTLAAPFGREQVLDVLAGHALPVRRGWTAPPADTAERALPAAGLLVAVTGPGGTGRSTLAAALAQGLAAGGAGWGTGTGVVLADCCLHASQAALHGTPDVIPGVPELVEAHRNGRPADDDVRSLCWEVATRGYDVLLGVRRHRDWAALRPRAVAAAVESLRSAYRAVVADVDADVEGHAETGSADVEDRNVLARTVLEAAHMVVVVGVPGLAGVHRLGGTVHDLVRWGVDPSRVLPVVNLAPRNPRDRAELAAALAVASGLGGTDGRSVGAPPSPLFVRHRRTVEAAHRDAAALPGSLAGPLAAAVAAVVEALAPSAMVPAGAPGMAPVPVRPGELGVRGHLGETA